MQKMMKRIKRNKNSSLIQFLLIIHHLINSFDYDRLRKTDFIEVETSGEKFSAVGGKKLH
jgi:hypothetical protein